MSGALYVPHGATNEKLTIGVKLTSVLPHKTQVLGCAEIGTAN